MSWRPALAKLARSGHDPLPKPSDRTLMKSRCRDHPATLYIHPARHRLPIRARVWKCFLDEFGRGRSSKQQRFLGRRGVKFIAADIQVQAGDGPPRIVVGLGRVTNTLKPGGLPHLLAGDKRPLARGLPRPGWPLPGGDRDSFRSPPRVGPLTR